MLRSRFALAAAIALLATSAAAEDQSDVAESPDRYETVVLQGRVTWTAEALRRLHGVRTDPEVAEQSLVLETAAGELHPLAEDARGIAFRRDERLREIDVELLGRRHHGSPFIQVVEIRELRDGRRYELDYWCEICAIAMYELKACDCCQGPIELRRRLIEEPPVEKLSPPDEDQPAAEME